MKVVLFCGGLGLRMRRHPSRVPKPMERIGPRPILWHLMRYYAHYGHREFILCLGYRGDVIERYFVRDDGRSTVVSARAGATTVRIRTRDTGEWTIRLVPTGIHTSIGQRIKAIAPDLSGEESFLANYTDGLSDLVLPDFVQQFRESGKVAGVLCVRPNSTFHFVSLGPDNVVEELRHARHPDTWINGGFFAFRREILDYIERDEDLVAAPFARLIAQKQLLGYRHEGFWACMDTPEDKQLLQELHRQGRPPWKVWRRTGAPQGHARVSLRQ